MLYRNWLEIILSLIIHYRYKFMTLYLKKISAKIPGYNCQGHLFETTEILKRINSEGELFDPTFVERKIGVRSVATSLDSYFYLENADPESCEAVAEAISGHNPSLFGCLEDAVMEVYNQPISAHIHITSYPYQSIGYYLEAIRDSIGIETTVGEITTIILQHGCAGIIAALKMASNFVDAGDVLITADNNMMPQNHNRIRKYAGRANMNDWLFPSIFGEGVGALTVSKSEGSFELTINHHQRETDESRVYFSYDEEFPITKLLGREVSHTFRKGISKGIETAFSRLSVTPTDVMIHESNPKLVNIIVDQHKLHDYNVPILSPKVGSLACVSSFSLLDDLWRRIENGYKVGNVVLAVIGETGGHVESGSLILSPAALEGYLRKPKVDIQLSTTSQQDRRL